MLHRLLPGLLWLFPTLALAAPPHLDLELRLDPATRALSAKAVLTGLSGPLDIALDPALRVERLVVDGRARRIARGGEARLRVPAGRRVEVAYAGRLAPLARADHRGVLGGLPAMADPEGSYLPAGGGWYPDPGQPFTYRLRLALPAGQKGLAPGTLARESDTPKGYAAEYDFPHPTEGIDLMAGPYVVRERALALEGGRAVRLRTWFHPELAGLADDYLADSGRYIERYSRLIGAYPFESFSVVSSPLPTGFGMPSLTYLGREVLRLPFIRATSLGHEVLHNWWGNGVYPDWGRGNWSEGLTTFLADYAYQEDKSPAAARQTRLAWLRDLAAVPESADSALRAFTSRQHGIASIVGYNKAAMVFLMLRDRIGAEAFQAGLRRFWQQHRFRTAGWAELERAFADASGQDLAAFFAQWVDRPGAPRLKLAGARAVAGGVAVAVEQAPGDAAYALRVPVDLLVYPDRRETRWLDLTGPRTEARLAAEGMIQAVDLDPDYRLWRRLDPALLPPILREVFVAPRVGLLVAGDGAEVAEAARSLAGRLADHPAAPLAEPRLLEDGATLIIGTDTRELLARLGLPARPLNLAGRGSAQAWAGRDEAGRPYAVISGRDAQALRDLERALPHHGRQSWLVFDGPRAADKGVWPARAERIRVEEGAGGRPDRPLVGL